MNLKGISAVWLSQTDLTNLNAGEGGSNFVDVKKYKKEGIEYPYVSGQAMRYYLREAIRKSIADGEFMCVPNDKGETCGEIEKCLNCDLFGFMTTIKKGTKTLGYPNGHPGGAAIRISPVKVSPAIGLLPFDENATMDYLTRRKPQEKAEKMTGDIVNVELGVNLYKAGISIDLRRIGGKEVVNQKDRAVSIEYALKDNKRISRVKSVLEALRYISDYSKQARLLTDFTPDIIAIALQSKYSHRLQKLFELDKKDGKIAKKLDIKRLQEILVDVTKYGDKILFGMISGIIENEEEVKEVFEKERIKIQKPHEAILAAINEVK